MNISLVGSLTHWSCVFIALTRIFELLGLIFEMWDFCQLINWIFCSNMLAFVTAATYCWWYTKETRKKKKVYEKLISHKLWSYQIHHSLSQFPFHSLITSQCGLNKRYIITPGTASNNEWMTTFKWIFLNYIELIYCNLTMKISMNLSLRHS
jgi:hypothetical protein